MLDFICIVSAELFGTERERIIQNEKYVSSMIQIHPRHATAGKSAL